MKLPKLQILERFTSPEVILKFSRDYHVSVEQSEMIFKESIKMLWLMVKHQKDLGNATDTDIPEDFNLHKPLETLDKMWHVFILFTKEYHAFCDTYFGSYLHHVPCSDKEYKAFKQRALEQKNDFIQKERQSIGKFVNYIKDNLGSDTLKRWFLEIPILKETPCENVRI